MEPIQRMEIPGEIEDYTGCIKKLSFPRQGSTSDVAIVDTGSETYILKRASHPLYRTWLRKEALFLQKWEGKVAVTVPRIYKVVDLTDQGDVWVLMERFAGETLRNCLLKEQKKERKEELIFAFGKAMANIHQSAVPMVAETQASWLDGMLEQAEHNLRHYGTDGSFELLEKLKKNHPAPVQQTLVHGDFTVDNVLIHNRDVAAVIDWSGGAYGDPRYDAALAIRPKECAFHTDADSRVFFEGYGKNILGSGDYEYFADGLYEFF